MLSDWLLFPWKLLFAYSKRPFPILLDKDSPPLPQALSSPLSPPTAAAERSQVWKVLGRKMQQSGQWDLPATAGRAGGGHSSGGKGGGLGHLG